MNDTIAILTDTATGYRIEVRRADNSAPNAREAEIQYEIDLLAPVNSQLEENDQTLIDSTVTIPVLSDGTGPYEFGIHDRISY